MIPFCKVLEKANFFFKTEGRKLLAWRRAKGRDYKSAQENLGVDGYVHYPDCSDGFMVNMCHNFYNCTL